MSDEASHSYTFRLPDSLIARVDAYKDALNLERPGLDSTRTDGVRMLLTHALDRVESSGYGMLKDEARKPKPKPRK
jgi:hypothetical protein